jgi:hypothetical protein
MTCPAIVLLPARTVTNRCNASFEDFNSKLVLLHAITSFMVFQLNPPDWEGTRMYLTCL